MKLSTLSLDHLGLVTAIFDALGISELIDGLIPKTRECKLSHSEGRSAGCVLNGTTAADRRAPVRACFRAREPHRSQPRAPGPPGRHPQGCQAGRGERPQVIKSKRVLAVALIHLLN
jgi:hypothetical protein